MVSQSRDHILLFPFMAPGHIIPFLAPARLIEQRTHFIITLVNTPLNIRMLQSSLPPDSSIRLHSLPFSSADHGLPPGTENTDGLPYPLLVRLFVSSTSLRPAFEQLVSEMSPPPLCIISDMFLGWTVEVAEKFDVFHSVFVASGAYGTAVYFSLWLNLPHAGNESDEFALPDFPEAHVVHRTQMSAHLRAANATDEWSLFMQPQLSFCRRSHALLFNTAEELESTGFDYFCWKATGAICAIGPISLIAGRQVGVATVRQPGVPLDQCIEWLDLHGPSSVLYICFGSMNTISAAQMMELAMVLEASGKPFIWVVRPPLECEESEEFRDKWLPKGFEARMRERGQGMLVRRWSQQAAILAHPSIGAFVSHCGWNSVVESLTQGVPVIGWPLSAEQFYNSKLMEEELGVCVEVARGNRSEVCGDRVAEAIGMVLGGTEKGEEMRKKAMKLKEMMADAVRDEKGYKGSSIRALEEFIKSIDAVRDEKGYKGSSIRALDEFIKSIRK